MPPSRNTAFQLAMRIVRGGGRSAFAMGLAGGDVGEGSGVPRCAVVHVKCKVVRGARPGRCNELGAKCEVLQTLDELPELDAWPAAATISGRRESSAKAASPGTKITIREVCSLTTNQKMPTKPALVLGRARYTKVAGAIWPRACRCRICSSAKPCPTNTLHTGGNARPRRHRWSGFELSARMLPCDPSGWDDEGVGMGALEERRREFGAGEAQTARLPNGRGGGHDILAACLRSTRPEETLDERHQFVVWGDKTDMTR